MQTNIIVLAAGKGTRMRSNKAKVLQRLADKPLLQHVIDAAKTVANPSVFVIVGFDQDNVKSQFADQSITWVEQQQQLGTAHAVAQALPLINQQGKTLILYGDVPLVSANTLDKLLHQAEADSMAVLTVDLANPTGYGRIIRQANGQISAIVEQKDANAEQLQITECNSGIMAVDSALLAEYLPQIGNQNAQQEFYLTDLIGLLSQANKAVYAVKISNSLEVQGVNDKKQLAQLERDYQRQQAEQLLEQGVSLIDPNRLDIRGSLRCGQDVSIDVNCIFQGEVELADNVSIEAHCIIGTQGETVRIGKGTQIKAQSIIEAGIIGEQCTIGPFARIRPGTELKNGAKIGNFVETKKSIIGEGSKVNHLTYMGDAVVGRHANIGAGTITCNYDGVNKFTTEIGDEAFIGSNSSLVAPVSIGAGATVGAGSTITSDIQANELAVGRGKQRNIQGWQRPRKK